MYLQTTSKTMLLCNVALWVPVMKECFNLGCSDTGCLKPAEVIAVLWEKSRGKAHIKIDLLWKLWFTTLQFDLTRKELYWIQPVTSLVYCENKGSITRRVSEWHDSFISVVNCSESNTCSLMFVPYRRWCDQVPNKKACYYKIEESQ